MPGTSEKGPGKAARVQSPGWRRGHPLETQTPVRKSRVTSKPRVTNGESCPGLLTSSLAQQAWKAERKK